MERRDGGGGWQEEGRLEEGGERGHFFPLTTRKFSINCSFISHEKHPKKYFPGRHFLHDKLTLITTFVTKHI